MNRAQRTRFGCLELEHLEDRTLPASTMTGTQTAPPPPNASPARERPPAPPPNSGPARQAPPQGQQQPGDGQDGAGQPPAPNSPPATVPGNAGLPPVVVNPASVAESLRGVVDRSSFPGAASLFLPLRAIEVTATGLLTQPLQLNPLPSPSDRFLPLAGTADRTAVLNPARAEVLPGESATAPRAQEDVPRTAAEPLLLQNFGLLTPLLPFGNRSLEQLLSDFRGGTETLFSRLTPASSGANWTPWIVAAAISAAACEVGRRILQQRHPQAELAGGPLLFPGSAAEGGHE